MTRSLWAEYPLPEFPPLEGDVKTDVLIIGGGLAGLLCGWRLRQEGVSCLVAEADRLCRGATGNTTAKITSQHGLIYDRLLKRFGPEGARAYWLANQDALTRYRRLAQTLDFDFTPQSHFVYTLDDPGKLERELEALERIGARGRFRGDLPLPFGTAGAVEFPDQGRMHPRKLAAGLLEGLTIHEGTPVRGFDGRAVVTDRGRIRAEKIIVATHFPIFNKHGGYFLKLYQQRSWVVALEGAADPGGMYLDERQGGLSLRGHDGYVLLGGGSHRTGKGPCGWDMLESAARRWYPEASIRSRWAAQDCMSLDGVPYIGRYSRGTPEVYVATGFNKWGMTWSMAAAGILTDLIQGRENPCSLLTDPSRRPAAAPLLMNCWESARNLLTPTRPRCPHMGCALKWDPREQSWDCPCHGSRFARDGTVLDGPAAGELEQR